MEYFKYNLNFDVYIKIKDRGIKHYVEQHNAILPFEYHTSFREFKNRENKDGFHVLQFHNFMDCFGNLGLSLPEYIDLNIFIKKKEFIDVNLGELGDETSI